MKEKLLITGGAGFIGSNLANKLSIKYEVVVLDSLYKKQNKSNLEFLKQNNIQFVELDIRDSNKVFDILKDNNFDSVIHLAAQVAMTKSIKDPGLDFSTNVIGTLNIIDSLRKINSDAKFINICSNKVYGDMAWDQLSETATRYNSIAYSNGYKEDTKLDFTGPYGCSKGSAEQYVLDYARTYDLNTVSLRLSTIYGKNQFSTFDQGWIGWFIKEFFEYRNNTEYLINIQGNGKQVRDILYVDDLSNLFMEILEKDFSTLNDNCFNVGGGQENSFSIIELLQFLASEHKLNNKFNLQMNEWRKGDQKYYVSDISKISQTFDWKPSTTKAEGVMKYLKWIQES